MTDLESIPEFPNLKDPEGPVRLVPRHNPPSGLVEYDVVDTEQITQARKFDTGATRSSDEGKLDLEGFLSPLTLLEYGRYMDSARRTPEGVRASDNWQLGIPQEEYMKSMFRHFHAVWLKHRGHAKGDILVDLMGLFFNVQAMAHEVIKERNSGSNPRPSAAGNL